MNFVILNQRCGRKKWHVGSSFDCVIGCWRVPSLAMVSKLSATLVQTKGKSLLNGLTGSIFCHTDCSSRECHYPEVGGTGDYLCTASSFSLFDVGCYIHEHCSCLIPVVTAQDANGLWKASRRCVYWVFSLNITVYEKISWQSAGGV